MASFGSTATPSPASDLYHSASESNEDFAYGNYKDDDCQPKLDLPSSSIESVNSTIFSGILLAVWDNIMGPRVRKLWLSQANGNKIEQEMISYVCNHTLNGELTRIGKEGLFDTKFYCLKDRGYIFKSTIFAGKAKNGLTVWSLSILMGYRQLERYLTLQSFLALQIKDVVVKCRILQEKDVSNVPAMLSPYIQHFVSVVESLQVSGLPEILCIRETFFGSHELSPIGSSVTTKFLMRAITSHLQTGGSSVVIGKSESVINAMVTTLAQFLSPSERACCRYTDSKDPYPFDRDLFIQALLRKSVNDSPYLNKDIALSSYPCTLIDMDNTVIRQTPLFQNHAKMRVEFMKMELSLLLRGEEGPIYPTSMYAVGGDLKCMYRRTGMSNIGTFTDGLFTQCDQIATMVQQFVSEITLLPNLCSIREVYVENFVKVLQQQANALLSYTEAISDRGKVALGPNDIRQMRQDLDLTSEADFSIVLAWTEKACPGICAYLLGDNRQSAASMQAILEAL